MLLAAFACSRAGRVYEARGIVREVQRDYAQVVVEHEDIPGLMPAMTMNFDVADPALLDLLEPGQAIEFEIEFTGRSYRITRATVRENGKQSEGPMPLSRVAGVAEPAPDFRLIDQEGRRLALADLRGQAVVLDFIFTHCPGPCPILTGLHVELQRSLSAPLRERTRFVSISLDPARDTPEALRAYAQARGADLATWSFVTGPVAELEVVLRRYGVGTVRAEDGTIEHVVVTYLIDPAGKIARRYVGLEHESAEIARDLARLLQAPPKESARPGATGR